ncbi:MAG: hypothetical protein IKO28_01660 [Prevotella sp.]|nr:hypothetical protein [Prevotella sp.]MBR4650145.1 hypothetical protein [Prevotella sp.]
MKKSLKAPSNSPSSKSMFNPEHDIVLALNAGKGFVPPRAARKLREDLAFLPSIWGDDDEEVSVWGWDAAVVAELVKQGVPREKMPTDEQLSEIRRLSNRSLAVELLRELREMPGTTGYSEVCTSVAEVEDFIAKHGETILKAPWSSSGRGVKEAPLQTSPKWEAFHQWMQNLLAHQGSIIVEEKCEKVMDFALEYVADREGRIVYKGLSLFETQNGAYTGNLLLPEEEKREILRQYVGDSLMQEVSERIKQFLASRLRGIYHGPFGVDMLVAKNNCELLLNPCIEINLRRTMGHVALALTERGHRGTMAVTYNKEKDKYELIINNKGYEKNLSIMCDGLFADGGGSE